MSKLRIVKTALAAAGLLLFSHYSLAQVEGVYVSDGEDGCTLTIREIPDHEPQFGDQRYVLQSRGVAACMWDGVGISTSTNLAGAYVSLPPTNNRVFVSVSWLFGPSSNKIEVVQRNNEGMEILRRTYTRQ